ncbi:MAG: hypothetical protein K6E34_11140 [Lachnospiraceae bacterium]|nr:hypothetical protein [Lachnospiraceae bacterium]
MKLSFMISGYGHEDKPGVDDRCGPPYTIVFDDDYETLCPWASVTKSGKVWPDELTDAAVELFESEKNNREQRRRKREARNNKDFDTGRIQKDNHY